MKALFRSWNKLKGKYYYFFNGKYYDNIECKPFNCVSERICKEFNWENAEQFTGLTDKNGNKIFEGDKFQGDEPGEYYIVNWNKEEAIFQMDLYGYNVSISSADKANGSPKIGDMIARNPKDYSDQWLVSEKYFKDNFDL